MSFSFFTGRASSQRSRSLANNLANIPSQHPRPLQWTMWDACIGQRKPIECQVSSEHAARRCVPWSGMKGHHNIEVLLYSMAEHWYESLYDPCEIDQIAEQCKII